MTRTPAGALELADRGAIAELVNRYAAYVDDRDLDAAADLFCDDADLVVPRPPEVMTPADSVHGRDGIAKALSRVLRLDGTIHEIVGHMIDVHDDGSVTGRTACVAHHFIGGKDDQWHIHYADAYRRTSEGWRFARRAYTVDSMRVIAVRHPRPGVPGE